MRVASYVLALFVGAAFLFVFQQTLERRVTSNWIDLAKENSGKYGASMDVMMSDLPIPPIASTHGRAKSTDQGSSSNVRLGHVLTVVADEFDKPIIRRKDHHAASD